MTVGWAHESMDAWTLMDAHGCSWMLMDAHGGSWTFSDDRGCLRTLAKFFHEPLTRWSRSRFLNCNIINRFFTNFRKLSQTFANFRKFSQIFANFRKLSKCANSCEKKSQKRLYSQKNYCMVIKLRNIYSKIRLKKWQNISKWPKIDQLFAHWSTYGLISIDICRF